MSSASSRAAEKFKTRYATFGFNDAANLDEGTMWPTSFARPAHRSAVRSGFRLPDGLLAGLDTFAGELNRAEAVRILLDAGLVNAEQVDPGSTHGNRR